MAVHTGLRQGELLGLRWKDIDLEGSPARLTVRRSLKVVAGGLGFGPLKNKASRRSVPLNKTAVAALREHRLSQNEERREIIERLRSIGEPAGPKEISEALGKSYNNVKQLLYKMSNDAEVRSIGGGKYVPITDNLGNSGNRDGKSKTPESSIESATADEEQDSSSCPDPGVTAVTEVIGNHESHTLICSQEQLESVLAEIQDTDAVDVDLETTGLNPRKDRVRLLSITTDSTWLIDCFEVDPSPLFPILGKKSLTFHNGLFDLGFLFEMGFEFEEGGEVVDTLLMSQVLEDDEPRENEEAA